jgi:hypothetical protein
MHALFGIMQQDAWMLTNKACGWHAKVCSFGCNIADVVS